MCMHTHEREKENEFLSFVLVLPGDPANGSHSCVDFRLLWSFKGIAKWKNSPMYKAMSRSRKPSSSSPSQSSLIHSLLPGGAWQAAGWEGGYGGCIAVLTLCAVLWVSYSTPLKVCRESKRLGSWCQFRDEESKVRGSATFSRCTFTDRWHSWDVYLHWSDS